MMAEAPRASRFAARVPAITPDTRQRHHPHHHPGTRQEPFVCDNSVFPSALPANPALTIMALGLRTADAFLAARE